MNIVNKLNNYIRNNDFQLIYLDGAVNIVNYDEIKEFSNVKIVIRYSNGICIINGSSLVVSKMVDNEVLIAGVINNIEFR